MKIHIVSYTSKTTLRHSCSMLAPSLYNNKSIDLYSSRTTIYTLFHTMYQKPRASCLDRFSMVYYCYADRIALHVHFHHQNMSTAAQCGPRYLSSQLPLLLHLACFFIQSMFTQLCSIISSDGSVSSLGDAIAY